MERAELEEAHFDRASTGFGEAEIDALPTDDPAQTPDDGNAASDAADDVIDVPAVAASCTGDRWALGNHRLLCGDATDPTAVAAPMAGDQARLYDLAAADAHAEA